MAGYHRCKPYTSTTKVSPPVDLFPMSNIPPVNTETTATAPSKHAGYETLIDELQKDIKLLEMDVNLLTDELTRIEAENARLKTIQIQIPVPANSVDVKTLTDELARVRAENVRLKTVKVLPPACCVCVTNRVNVRFSVCQHAVCCVACAKNLNTCPMCRIQLVRPHPPIYFS